MKREYRGTRPEILRFIEKGVLYSVKRLLTGSIFTVAASEPSAISARHESTIHLLWWRACLPPCRSSGQKRKSAGAARLSLRVSARTRTYSGPRPGRWRRCVWRTPNVWQNGDPTNHDLRLAAGSAPSRAGRQYVIGEGVDALLGLTVRAFVAAGRPGGYVSGCLPDVQLSRGRFRWGVGDGALPRRL